MVVITDPPSVTVLWSSGITHTVPFDVYSMCYDSRLWWQASQLAPPPLNNLGWFEMGHDVAIMRRNGKVLVAIFNSRSASSDPLGLHMGGRLD
jgi:hypothetical protein